MARKTKLTIVSDVCNAEVKLAGMERVTTVGGKKIALKSNGTPEIKRRSPEGKELKFTQFFTSDDGTEIVVSGLTSKYVDEDGQICDEPVCYFTDEDGNEIQTRRYSQTKVWKISKFEPASNYTDKYQMEKYYTIEPSQGDSKKDMDKKVMISKNTREMKKLWDHLESTGSVGRGELITSSNGYSRTYGYVRAAGNEDEWYLEVGLFKQAKIPSWVGKGEEEEIVQSVAVPEACEIVDEI